MPDLALPRTALDDLAIDQQRLVLLDLAKLENPTLSMIGATPPDDAVYVLDTFDSLAVGTEEATLKAYAQTNALEITGPHETSTDTGAVKWEVRMSAGGSEAMAISAEDTQEKARFGMFQTLRDLCGDRVQALHAWAGLQAAGTMEESMLEPEVEAPKPKLSSFVVNERITLATLPLAPSVALKLSDQRPKKERRKSAYEQLNEPKGLGSTNGGTIRTEWNLPVLRDENAIYANHHDLLAALKLGLNVDGIEPWPNDIAHKFLLQEALRAAMRERGYVEITDFEPATMVHLRVSLPEFSEEVTGLKAKKEKKGARQEKPVWPPSTLDKQRVVIVLNRARLAFEVEPEWETVSMRAIFPAIGHLWVEEAGPTLKKRVAKSIKAPLPLPVKKPLMGKSVTDKALKSRKASSSAVQAGAAC